MGYTHFYKRHIDLANNDLLYDKYVNQVGLIIKTAISDGLQVADWRGEQLGDYELTYDRISFNGYGENRHESFVWQRFDNEKPRFFIEPEDGEWIFNFCKTAHKPYDYLVTACLTALSEVYQESVRISSDGTYSDWNQGLNLFERAIGYNPSHPLRKKVTV
jgi:hypothetical protein